MRQQLESAGLNEENLNENKNEEFQIENVEPVIQEKKKEKAAQRVPRVKPEVLIDVSSGLYKVYKTNKETIKKYENNDPERFVNNILSDIRSWGHNLLPRYDYPYFLDRVQNVGKDAMVTTMMSRMRALHVGEIQEDEFMELYGQKNTILDLLDKQVGNLSQTKNEATNDNFKTQRGANKEWRGSSRGTSNYKDGKYGGRGYENRDKGQGQRSFGANRGLNNRGAFNKQKSGNHYESNVEKRIK